MQQQEQQQQQQNVFHHNTTKILSYLKGKKIIKKLLNPNKEWISVTWFLIKIKITLTSSPHSLPIH